MNRDIARGDIYYISKNPKYAAVGREEYAARPAVIVSDGESAFGIVTVVFLTTSPKTDSITHVKVNCNGKKSIALCEQINTVSVDLVGNMMGVCSDEEMAGIEYGMQKALGMNMSGSPMVQDDGLIAENDRMSKELAEARKDATFYRDLYEALRARYM